MAQGSMQDATTHRICADEKLPYNIVSIPERQRPDKKQPYSEMRLLFRGLLGLWEHAFRRQHFKQYGNYNEVSSASVGVWLYTH